MWKQCGIVFAALAAILWLMGRPLWCGCGSWALWTTGNEHYSQHLFDPWVFSHVFHGGFFYGAFRGFMTRWSWRVAVVTSLVVEGLWEILENTPWIIEAYRASGDRWYMGDTILNSLGDLLACLTGALILAGLFRLTRKSA